LEAIEGAEMLNLIPSRRKEQSTNERPLARLRNDLESLFDRISGGWMTPSDMQEDQDALGRLNLEDRDDEIVVRAVVPGFEPKEIDVELDGQLLTIRAEKKQEKKSGNCAEERIFRSFHETMTLPEGIKADQIEAKNRNGVLEIHLPRRDDAKPKRIPVRA
jgi:HSP20 family protein